MFKALFLFGLTLHTQLAIPVGNNREVSTKNDAATEEVIAEKSPSELAISKLNLPSNSTYIRADITDSGFSCENKSYGYYADIENDCQIFHVCLPVKYADGKESLFRWSFICPEETIFSQESFTCMRSEDMVIACDESEDFFGLNSNFGIPVEEKPSEVHSEVEKSPEVELPIPDKPEPSSTTTTSTTKKPYVYRRKTTANPVRTYSAPTIAPVQQEEDHVQQQELETTQEVHSQIKQEKTEQEQPPEIGSDTTVVEVQDEIPVEVQEIQIPEAGLKSDHEDSVDDTQNGSVINDHSSNQQEKVEFKPEETIKVNDPAEPNETDIVSALIDSLANDDDDIVENKNIQASEAVKNVEISNINSVQKPTEVVNEVSLDDSKSAISDAVDSLLDSSTSRPISIDDVIDLVKDSLDITTKVNDIESTPEVIVPIYNRDSTLNQKDSKIIQITKTDNSTDPLVDTQTSNSKIIPIEIKESPEVTTDLDLINK